MNFELLESFSENTQIPNFVEVRPVGAKLFQADGQTNSHDIASSFFLSQFYERVQNWITGYYETEMFFGFHGIRMCITVFAPASL